MYREAWNSAHTMAKMAERAYRFEHSEDHAPLLNGNYWDANYEGLLAGQKLLIDLQNLERRYIETHHRRFVKGGRRLVMECLEDKNKDY